MDRLTEVSADIYILIPAYKPDEKFVAFVRALPEGYRIIAVDDGGGPDYAPFFDQAREAGVTVLTHPENRGKGAALKTGIRYLVDSGASGIIVTADADGQHDAADIASVAAAMEDAPDTLIIGGRDFSMMPPRSRVGNTLTRFFFRLFTGLSISDTQTGLRGLPRCLWEKLLDVPGDRYEYEMNMLLAIPEWKCAYLEIPIETIYIENNASTHFNALRDGTRVFSKVLHYGLSRVAGIFKFSASSLICAGIDYVLYILLGLLLTPQLSYVGARVISAIANYQLNRRLVFRGKPSIIHFLEYAALAVVAMIVGSFAVGYLTSLGIGKVTAKLIVDALMFFANYFVQRELIFNDKQDKASGKNKTDAD